MRKISLVFGVLAANSLTIATGLYYIFIFYKKRDALSLSQQFTNSAIAYLNPLMQTTLFFYILGSFLVGVSFIIAIYIKDNRTVCSIFQDKFCVYGTIFAIVVPIAMCFVKTPALILIWILFWVFLLLVLKQKHRFIALIRQYCQTNIIPKIVLLGAIAFIIHMFLPLVFTTPNIMNAFFRIPEMFNIGKVDVTEVIGNKLDTKYYKKETHNANVYMDTTRIVNEFGLSNIHEHVDIFNYQDWKSNRSCLEVPEKNERLSDFIATYTHEVVRPAPGAFWESKKYYNFPPMLDYSENRLCIIPPIGSQRFTASASVYVDNKLKELGIDASSLLDNYIELEINNNNTDIGLFTDNRRNPLKEQDFLQAATIATYLKHSALERSFIANQRSQLKHHIYYLFPSYEYLMGKPLNKIVVQYGVGHTLLLSAVGKVVQFFGSDPTYGGSLNFLASFYFIGCAIFVVSLSLIFKDVRLASMTVLLLILHYIMLGYDFSFIAPGIYELRFIFDMPAVYCLYRYGVTKQNSFLWCLLAILFLALFNNFEFGLFLTAAMLGTLLIHRLMEQAGHPQPVYFAVGVAGISLAYYVFSIPSVGIASYFLLGLFTVKVAAFTIGCFILMLAVYILMFLHMRNNNSSLAYPFLAIAFYSQTILCFYVWCGYFNHFYILFSRLALPALFYFSFLLKEKVSAMPIKNLMYYFAVIALITAAYGSYEPFRRYKNLFENTFEYHKVYAWNNHGTNIKSTMNPDFFEPAVAMIKKYLSDRKDLYMISQYDFLLTYLAKKYSGMPHFDLASNIVSAKGIDLAVAQLRRDQPEYIFVDSDIDVPYELSLPPFGGHTQIYAEGYWNILTLNHLRAIYKAAISDYTLVERGQMISVYRLKEKSAR